jgi:hypothetical protein
VLTILIELIVPPPVTEFKSDGVTVTVVGSSSFPEAVNDFVPVSANNELIPKNTKKIRVLNNRNERFISS